MSPEARAAAPSVSSRPEFLAPPEGESEVLERLCRERRLEVHFQPVIRLATGEILGYEARVCPAPDAPFSTASDLFASAARHGLLGALEMAGCTRAVAKFAKLGLRGKLLLGLSPSSIVEPEQFSGEGGFEFLHQRSLDPGRIVVQLAEQQGKPNLERLCEAVMRVRSLGADIAIGDLGEGLTSLWLWSELRPQLVKISVHFVTDVHRNPIRFQFLKAIQQIADGCGSQLVAEGIADKSEYAVLRDIGIAFGQGRFIARAAAVPAPLKAEILQLVRSHGLCALPQVLRLAPARRVTGEKLLIPTSPVTPDTANEAVFRRFDAEPGLPALPVVSGARPVGLIGRNAFLSLFGRQGERRDFGRLACEHAMDRHPLQIEKRLPLHEITERVIRGEMKDLECFVFTDEGGYAGIGLGQDLIREVTLLQIEAARYANPLTLLPGNVPIDEHVAALLEAGKPFVAAWCDLNHFKAFNDAYGYRRGDDMIRLAARVLSGACDRAADFIGHIGGDDFLLVLASEDWQARCERALGCFAAESRSLFDEEDRSRGSLKGEDRAGKPVYSPLVTLAIGAVPADPGCFASHLEVAEAATEAKRQAKRLGGNALFVERRRKRSVTRS